jgi:hypothetical protein
MLFVCCAVLPLGISFLTLGCSFMLDNGWFFLMPIVGPKTGKLFYIFKINGGRTTPVFYPNKTLNQQKMYN